MAENQAEKKLSEPILRQDRNSDPSFSNSSIGENGPALKVDVSEAKKYLEGRVREAVEEILQLFLEEESKALCGAERYERTESRKGHRNGYRTRNLVTRVGNVMLKVPRLRELAFTTAIIERYQRRECSIDEALIEMYFAGVSTRRVADITEALWGGKVSADQMSTLNQKVFEQLEAWRSRRLAGNWPYVFCDGMVLSRKWDTEVRNVSVLLSVGVSEDGRREVIGVAEGCKEDKESWLAFLRWLKERGLAGVELFTTDKCLGLVQASKETFPDAAYQRCIVHFYRNVLTKVPWKDMNEVAQALKAIHAQENAEEARVKAQRFVEKYGERFPAAVKVVQEGLNETLTYFRFPQTHWRYIRTTNMVERLIREVRRRTDVVGAFPDAKSALLLICARVQWVTEKSWGKKRYLLMKQNREVQNDVDEKILAR